jgi:hypothetical protein
MMGHVLTRVCVAYKPYLSEYQKAAGYAPKEASSECKAHPAGGGTVYYPNDETVRTTLQMAGPRCNLQTPRSCTP